MRRKYFIFALLILLAAGLMAQESTAALRFKLLEADEYELDMFYSTELQRLYMQVDFELPKSSLDPDYYYGIFLHKDAQIQAITVSGSFEAHYWANNLQPEHFEPHLPQPELLVWNSPARFFGIHLNSLKKYPETPHFRIWYYIEVPPFRLDESNKLTTGLDAADFWYPRNISRESTVKVTMTTTPYISLRVGNSFASKLDKQYARTHKNTYVEIPAQPCGFRLIRD